MLPAKSVSIWPSIFRGEDFLTLANQKQELPLAAIFAGGMVVVVMLVYGLPYTLWGIRFGLFSLLHDNVNPDVFQKVREQPDG
jgi:hypothetical protein